MATPNLKLKSATPQEKPLVLHLTPEQIARRNRVDLWELEDGLKTVGAIRDVMDYLGENGKAEGVNVGIVFAGLGEALKVAHDRMARGIEAEETGKAVRRTMSVRPFQENRKAAGGGADTGVETASVGGKMEFTIVLTDVGGDKIGVIKAVRETTSLGLKEAKDLVDGAPKTVKEGVSDDEAASIRKKFEGAGAKVEIKAVRR